MLRIEHPTGEVFQISTREGPATAGFQIKDGEKYPTFYIDLATREQEQDAVRVTIRDGRRADSTVLHEFVLNSGGPAVRTATAPSFSLAFTGTHPPKNYGSSCFREQAMPLVPGFPPSP